MPIYYYDVDAHICGDVKENNIAMLLGKKWNEFDSYIDYYGMWNVTPFSKIPNGASIMGYIIEEHKHKCIEVMLNGEKAWKKIRN